MLPELLVQQLRDLLLAELPCLVLCLPLRLLPLQVLLSPNHVCLLLPLVLRQPEGPFRLPHAKASQRAGVVPQGKDMLGFTGSISVLVLRDGIATDWQTPCLPTCHSQTPAAGKFVAFTPLV